VPRIDRLNRLLLTALGVVSLGAGVVALLAGVDALGDRTAHRPVLTSGARSFPAGHGWFWPVVGVAVAVGTLLALVWLPAQRSTGELRGLCVTDDAVGGVHVGADALTDAVEADAAGRPGVRAVDAALRGGEDRPLLRLTVVTDPETDLAGLRRDIEGEVVARARSAVGRPGLAAEIDLVPSAGPGPRAR
jgi:hypothetical protein